MLTTLLFLVVGFFVFQTDHIPRTKERVVTKGSSIRLECVLRSAYYNPFQRPVLWFKNQTEKEEESQMNLGGSMYKPFSVTNRLSIIFAKRPPDFKFSLNIRDVATEDDGIYRCEVRDDTGRVDVLSIHRVIVREKIDYVLLEKYDKYRYHSEEGDSITGVENNSFANIMDTQSGEDGARKNQKDQNNGGRNLNDNDGETKSSQEARKRPLKVLKAVSSILTVLRCDVVGGHPTPHVKIMISNRTLPREDFVVKSFAQVSSGERGLRVLEYRTMMMSERFMFRWQDDGKKMRCVARVPGMPVVHHISLLRLDYAPIITCPETFASKGDFNITLRCLITSRPQPIQYIWVVDPKGTSVVFKDKIKDNYNRGEWKRLRKQNHMNEVDNTTDLSFTTSYSFFNHSSFDHCVPRSNHRSCSKLLSPKNQDFLISMSRMSEITFEAKLTIREVSENREFRIVVGNNLGSSTDVVHLKKHRVKKEDLKKESENKRGVLENSSKQIQDVPAFQPLSNDQRSSYCASEMLLVMHSCIAVYFNDVLIMYI